MSMHRIRATELARLLNSVDRPLYVLDANGTIVFCNQSLFATIGPAAIDLVGRRCTYHGFAPMSTTGPRWKEPLKDAATGLDIDREREPKTISSKFYDAAAVATGLCPPPGAMQGRQQTATVSWVSKDGRLHQRLARFVPLPGEIHADKDKEQTDRVGGEVIAVVALVDAVDLDECATEADPGPSEAILPEAVQLHRCVQEFCHAAAARHQPERLIGNSTAMRLARRRVELAISSRAGVSIVGPPGSGRQHLADTIHYAWVKTRGRPSGTHDADPYTHDAMNGLLIPLDCSALGPELIRSTLDALGGGRLAESARLCTLALHGADRLAREVQTELASVFSSKTFQPRLIATSEQSLDELACKGRFDRDLATILGTIVIELPPLVQRREDLPLLAQMFVERENAAGDKQLGGLTGEALDCLDGYDWPGNVDELAMIIAEAHANATADMIAPSDLPKRIHLALHAAAYPRQPLETIVLDDFLAEIENELIQRAMQQAKGNKAKAARMLGLSRPRLYRRLIQLGIEKGENGDGSA